MKLKELIDTLIALGPAWHDVEVQIDSYAINGRKLLDISPVDFDELGSVIKLS